MSAQAVLIGIDLGSSCVKVGAFSIRGDPLSLMTKDLDPDPMDPDVWWNSTCEALNQGGSSGGTGLLRKEPLEGEGLLCCETILPGLWLVGGPTSAGGRTAIWFFRNVLRPRGDFTSC